MIHILTTGGTNEGYDSNNAEKIDMPNVSISDFLKKAYSDFLDKFDSYLDIFKSM